MKPRRVWTPPRRCVWCDGSRAQLRWTDGAGTTHQTRPSLVPFGVAVVAVDCPGCSVSRADGERLRDRKVG